MSGVDEEERDVVASTFDRDGFVEACREAVARESHAAPAVRELVQQAVSRPEALATHVGDLRHGPVMSTWYRSDDLTILHIVWPPDADLYAHDHNMWAVIGLHGGREDNRFFRRREDGRIDLANGRTLLTSDVVTLGHDVVHAVSNPSRAWTGALHVYGGDFFATPRTMWWADTLEPVPFDADRTRRYLEEAAARALAAEAAGEA